MLLYAVDEKGDAMGVSDVAERTADFLGQLLDKGFDLSDSRRSGLL